MKKILLISFILMSALITESQAQDRNISGKVMDNGGEGVPGVNVVLKGTNTGTVSNIDGNYKLSVPADGRTLVFSFIGMATQEVEIGSRTVIDVSMTADAKELAEVVVTAFGVKRSQKAIGYAVQEVKGSDIARSGASNSIDALVGKAAGIQVTRASGSVGGGSRIVVRNSSSMVGNNQPIIVIDGVRTNNDVLSSEIATAGTAQSNRLMDLNTDDIESINVLKGAAATALYGTAGSTGVIVITTKRGNIGEKLNVSFTSQFSIDNPTTFVDLQSEYGQGRLSNRVSAGAWPGNYTYRGPETGESGSWGPRIADMEYSKDRNHLYAPAASAFDSEGNYKFDKNGFLVPKGTGNGIPANTYNNVDPFFQTANSWTNSISVSGGSQAATFRFSASNLKANGVIPNEEYKRNTFKLASSLSPTDKLKLAGSINYTRSEHQRIQQGSNTSGLLLGMYRTPVSFDNTNGLAPKDAVNDPSSYQFPDFSQRNYRGGGGYDNPYWIINNALRNETVDRVFGNIEVFYKFHDWATLKLNTGFDVSADLRTQRFEIGTRTAASGRVTNDEYLVRQNDSYLSLHGSGNLAENFNLNYLVGINAFSYNNKNTFITGNGLVFPGFVDISNATDLSGGELITKYRTLGFFGQLEASWKNIVFLTFSGRQDYDSRLGSPTNFNISNTGFFYPSVSTSIIFTEWLPNNVLTFGKLRASWAQVGAGPPVGYATQTAYESVAIGDGWGNRISWPIGGKTGFGLDNLLGNNNLGPELSTTIELGTDLRFFEGRLGLDVTWYQRKTKDAILNANLTPATGYTNVWLNSGKMTTTGIEITVNATPLKIGDFGWNTQVNFTKSESMVEQLAPGLERLFLAGFQSSGSYLVAGSPYGTIFAGTYLREGSGGPNDDKLNIPAGKIVINDDPTSTEYGYQAVDDNQRVIGNPNPDFIVGWNNTFSYKSFSFNFLLDWRQGGDLWNGTAWALSFFGRSQLTADTRKETPFTIDGVKSDGTPNDIKIVRDQNYWSSTVGGFGAVGEQFVQDGGWIRLREIGVSYRFPSLFNNVIKSGSFGISGRNLWYTTDYDGIDPETSLNGAGSNGQGFDYFNMPSTKSLIFKLSVNF